MNLNSKVAIQDTTIAKLESNLANKAESEEGRTDADQRLDMVEIQLQQVKSRIHQLEESNDAYL